MLQPDRALVAAENENGLAGTAATFQASSAADEARKRMRESEGNTLSVLLPLAMTAGGGAMEEARKGPFA